LAPRAGAARAIRGNRSGRARVSHVCSLSTACNRQVSARAHVDEAAMGTLRSVGIRVLSRSTRSRACWERPGQWRAYLRRGGRIAQGQSRQYRLGATWSGAPRPLWGNFWAGQARRSPWVSSHASGGAAPVYRCTERRWDTKDCRQLHPVAEAPSLRAHRGMGQKHIQWHLGVPLLAADCAGRPCPQNHILDGWVEAVVRGRGRGVLGWDGSFGCPSAEGLSFPWGTSLGAGHPVYLLAGPRVPVQGRFPSGTLRGARGASPASPCTSPLTGPGSVASGVTGRSPGAEPSEGGPA